MKLKSNHLLQKEVKNSSQQNILDFIKGKNRLYPPKVYELRGENQKIFNQEIYPFFNVEYSELTCVNSDIKESFFQLIESLETKSETILCMRGDSFEKTPHDNFFTLENLQKIFIVGNKAKSFIVKPKYATYTNANSSSDIKKELKIIIHDVNEEIKKKPDIHDVKGIISETIIDSEDIKFLNHLKVFLLAFLHNIGSLRSFKSNSPFLSLTTKENIAIDFATNRSKHKKGIVYLYALNKSDDYYIKTSEMIKKLESYGIEKWYDDTHKEIILMNGMYPHYLLGIYEVEKDTQDINKFIINPALYQLLSEKKKFDSKNGLIVDQQNFEQFAKELGHEEFFFKNNMGTFVSNLSMRHIEECIDFNEN